MIEKEAVMRYVLCGLVLVIPGLCWGQATPGGVYRAPREDLADTWSYMAHKNATFTVTIYAMQDVKDRNGKAIGKYEITGNQAYGLKKNVEKWCKQRKFKMVGMTDDSIYVAPLALVAEYESLNKSKEDKKEPNPSDMSYMNEKKKSQYPGGLFGIKPKLNESKKD